MKKSGLIGFLLYAIFGIYFINFGFTFIPIPELISRFNSWIVSIGGLFMIFGGINYLRISKKVKIVK